MRKVRCGTYRPSKSVKKMLQDSLKIKLPVKILKKVSVLEQIEQHCSLTITVAYIYICGSKTDNKNYYILKPKLKELIQNLELIKAVTIPSLQQYYNLQFFPYV